MFSALSPTVTDSGATKSPVHWSVSMILSILHDHGHERELRSLLCRCWTHATGRGGFPVPTARSSCDRERQRGRRGVLRMTCRTREILPCTEEKPVLNPMLLEGRIDRKIWNLRSAVKSAWGTEPGWLVRSRLGSYSQPITP